MASRRTQGSPPGETHESDAPQTRVRPLTAASSVTSAFGPAPVWAGGSPSDSPAGRADHGDQTPPEWLPLSAPHPAPTTRAMLPPPVTMPIPPGSVNEPEPGLPEAPDRNPAGESVLTEGSGDEPPSVEVLAVPGNSAHASKVMHVSSLCAQAAREIPTAWMVVTPMDLLGDPPPASTSVPEVERTEPPPFEETILLTPNPFGPTRSPSSQLDLGMPSSLLSDLLGSEDPSGE